MKNLLSSLFLAAALAILPLTLSAQVNDPNLNQAVKLAGEGKIAEAIKHLDRNISNRISVFESHKLRAAMRMMTGDRLGALADYNAAIEIESTDPILYEQRGDLRMFSNDSKGAAEDFDKAFSLGLKTEKVFNMRAILKRNNGDLEGSLADYRAAAQLFPDSVSLIQGYALSLAMLERYDEAIDVLDSFLKKYEEENSGQPGTVNDLKRQTGTPMVQEGSGGRSLQVVVGTTIFKGAGMRELKEHERLLNIANAYNLVAAWQRRQGDAISALFNIEKSLKIHKLPNSLALRGAINFDMQNYEKAIADISEGYLIEPLFAIGYLKERGLAYLALGKNKEAEADFAVYLERFPESKASLEKQIEAIKAKALN